MGKSKNTQKIIQIDEKISGIQLPNNKGLALIDNDDIDKVNRYRWCLMSRDGMVMTSILKTNNLLLKSYKSCITLGRFVFPHPLKLNKTNCIKYKNKNKLDNRKENLILYYHQCTFNGVKIYSKNLLVAKIKHNDSDIVLGMSDDPIYLAQLVDNFYRNNSTDNTMYNLPYIGERNIFTGIVQEEDLIIDYNFLINHPVYSFILKHYDKWKTDNILMVDFNFQNQYINKQCEDIIHMESQKMIKNYFDTMNYHPIDVSLMEKSYI